MAARGSLTANRQEVVSRAVEPTDGCGTADALVRAMPVVMVRPASEHGGSLRGSAIGDAVGPLAQGGLDEALGLAIGLWPIRPGKAVLEPKPLTGVGEALERNAEPLSTCRVSMNIFYELRGRSAVHRVEAVGSIPITHTDSGSQGAG